MRSFVYWTKSATNRVSVMNLRIAQILAIIRQAGPYLAIELILPGGSLVALALWVLRNRTSLAARFFVTTRCETASPSRP